MSIQKSKGPPRGILPAALAGGELALDGTQLRDTDQEARGATDAPGHGRQKRSGVGRAKSCLLILLFQEMLQLALHLFSHLKTHGCVARAARRCPACPRAASDASHGRLNYGSSGYVRTDWSSKHLWFHGLLVSEARLHQVAR